VFEKNIVVDTQKKRTYIIRPYGCEKYPIKQISKSTMTVAFNPFLFNHLNFSHLKDKNTVKNAIQYVFAPKFGATFPYHKRKKVACEMDCKDKNSF